METIDAEFVVDDDGTLYFTGELPETWKEAFDVSIRKWKILVRLCKDGKYVDDGTGETCGLCMYARKISLGDDCAYCPIGQAIGNNCDGTRYWSYSHALWEKDIENMLYNAEQELDLLERLAKEYEDGGLRIEVPDPIDE